MNDIKAIETHYQGYRFRSRLEARWAVFMDALGVRWEYEKEGFDLTEVTTTYWRSDGTEVTKTVNAGFYLPDFWLPQQEAWLEIKPRGNLYFGDWNEEEYLKGTGLHLCTKKSVYILYGEPGPVELYDEKSSYWGVAIGDQPYVWCECPTCGSIDLQYDGRSARNKHLDTCEILRLRQNGLSHPIYGRTDDKVYNFNSPRLLAAYEAARSARFEHGESGAPSEGTSRPTSLREAREMMARKLRGASNEVKP